MKAAGSPHTTDLGLFTPGYRDKWNGTSDWCLLLSREAKGLYTQIIEQPGINRAGVLSVGTDVLAEQHPNTSEEEIEKDLAELIDKRYVVRDGSLLWVRRWFRYDRNICNPKYVAPIFTDIRSVTKPRLKSHVASSFVETIIEIQKQGRPLNPGLTQSVRAFASEMSVPASDLKVSTPTSTAKRKVS